VTSVIEQLGVMGVFLLMVPESACIPVPSEVTLLFSGFAVHQGWMSLPLVIVAATAGNLVGSLLAYGLGRSGLIDRVPRAGALLARWDPLLARHGMRAVLYARLLPLARTFVSLPAGSRRMPLRPFVALTILGCAIWAAAFSAMGLEAGAAWSAVDSILGRALLVAGMAVIALSLVRAGRRASADEQRRARSSAPFRHAQRAVSRRTGSDAARPTDALSGPKRRGGRHTGARDDHARTTP
jgi:membrane protein DedA with SNARE-associated domain